MNAHYPHQIPRLRTTVVLLIISVLTGSLFALAPVRPVRAAGGVIYVNHAATGTPNGSSWQDAFRTLQDALAVAAAGNAIWVAAGTYYPGATRGSTFQLRDGVVVYGGFVGSGANPDARDWVANVTILSGDLDQSGSLNDNDAYHVVTGANNATLDGFTITGGNANGGGGGVYNVSSSPTLSNVIISGNRAIEGGGVYNQGSSPTFTNVTISNNGSSSGGGVFNRESSPTFTNVTISGNSAFFGGGMYNWNSSPTLSNVTISGNSAGKDGGGMYNWNDSRPTLSNVIISSNQASDGCGGGMYNRSSSPTLSNVTLSGNSSSFGGGMCNHTVSSPTLSNVTISGNSALEGGGMHNWDNSNSTLSNVTISGNTASRSGGGMYNSSSVPTLNNATISGNRAGEDGGGMQNRFSNVRIHNSILWGNGSVIANDYSTPTISFSLIEGSGGSGSWNSTLGVDNGNNLDTNPRFVAPVGMASAPTSTGNYRLQANSPAINAGSNARVAQDVTTDLDGNLRIVAATVDLGAYEHQAPIPFVRSVTRATATPTNAATVVFTVTFNMPVTEVDSTDFTLAKTGGQSGATISSVTGSDTTWLVSVTTVNNATGNIGLNLVDDDSIVNSDRPDVPLGGSGTGNGNFTGEVYTVDRVPPTVTISGPSSTSTNSGPVSYEVSFAGANMYSFAVSDVTLQATGTATGSVVVNGSGPLFAVEISAITGNGALGISVAAGAASDRAEPAASRRA
jgi:hypothetical protein